MAERTYVTRAFRRDGTYEDVYTCTSDEDGMIEPIDLIDSHTAADKARLNHEFVRVEVVCLEEEDDSASGNSDPDDDPTGPPKDWNGL